MQNYLIGCDWGTTSFRLAIFDCNKNRLVGELHTQDGVASIHKDWQAISVSGNEITRHQYFKQQLATHIDRLSAAVSMKLDNIPVVISGMTSSSIGMEHVPYAPLPFAIDGSNTVKFCIDATDNFPHKIMLISGIMSNRDVMRGEETQLIGVLELLRASTNLPAEAVFVFPGTHSKHIRVTDGMITGFHTFMTGEIFHLLAHHSILKDSMQISDLKAFSESDSQAFRKGLKESSCSSLLNTLFAVRTNELFGRLDKRENFFYLSGLLIGSEVTHLLEKENCPLFLCSGSNLYHLYKSAFEELDVSRRTTIVPIHLVDNSAIAGQVLIYRKHLLNGTH